MYCTFVSFYVCMYLVCMYVMYICIYVMFVCTVCMYVYTVFMYVMYVQYVCMYVYMYVTYVCMYVWWMVIFSTEHFYSYFACDGERRQLWRSDSYGHHRPIGHREGSHSRCDIHITFTFMYVCMYVQYLLWLEC